jgi:hypothetical protein
MVGKPVSAVLFDNQIPAFDRVQTVPVWIVQTSLN